MKFPYISVHPHSRSSRSPHGERGLKCSVADHGVDALSRRSPHGERGLKYLVWASCARRALESLPARGAWIEIICPPSYDVTRSRRSPHGERGLKSIALTMLAIFGVSLPARGAWIEISFPLHSFAQRLSLPARGAWIEIVVVYSLPQKLHSSLPARGAWIEILPNDIVQKAYYVAPRTGSVD